MLLAPLTAMGRTAESPQQLEPLFDSLHPPPHLEPATFNDLSKFPDLQALPRTSWPGVIRQGAFYRRKSGEVAFCVAIDPQHVSSINLVLYATPQDDSPVGTIPLERINSNLAGAVLKGSGIGPGLLYNYLVTNSQPGSQHVVIDPYACALTRPRWISPPSLNGDRPPWPAGGVFIPPKSVVIERRPDFELLGHKPLHGIEKMLICELNVRDTRCFPAELISPEESSYLEKRGTFAFLSCPAFIRRLKQLGVTTLELMPVQISDDEYELVAKNAVNHWAYCPISFFALEPRLCFTPDPTKQIEELRGAIKALHKNGIEVIADLVIGHTNERTTQTGPSLSLRPLAEQQYYLHDHQGQLVNATACESALRIDTPFSQELLRRARDWFLGGLGLDGVRIDQAAVLGIAHSLNFNPQHPFLRAFPRHHRKIVIAEPNHGFGAFPRAFPEEWQVMQIWTHRDLAPKFFAGERHYHWEYQEQHCPASTVSVMSSLIAGNSHVFQGSNRGINIPACHDGHTTWDATLEMSNGLAMQRMAAISSDEERIDLRLRLCRALHASAIFSPGPLLFYYGDERLRTQRGRHNRYYRRLDANGEPEILSPPELSLTQMEEHAAFFEQCAALRKSLRVFDTRKHYRCHELLWYDADGHTIEGDLRRTIRDPQHLQLRLHEVWQRQAHFLAVTYPGKGFKAENCLPPILVARWGRGEGSMQLPRYANGWKLRLLVDSNSGFVHQGTIDTGEKFRLPLDQVPQSTLVEPGSSHHFPAPGVALFQLVRLPE